MKPKPIIMKHFIYLGLLAVCLTACSNDESLISEMPEKPVPESQNPNMRTPDEAVEAAERGLTCWTGNRKIREVRRVFDGKSTSAREPSCCAIQNPGGLMIPNILFML